MFRRTLTALALTLAASATVADEASLEPCINGGVSRTGNFPTQAMEDQIYAYLDWRADEPYYLFRVAARAIPTPYPED
jgi:hypothetical protein